MRSPSSILFVLAILALLVSCEDPPQRVLLADFDVAYAQEDPVYGDGWIHPRGLHEFAEGWRHPEPHGIWTTDAPARVYFDCLGRRAQLRLRLATHPRLAERHQRLTLSWNQQVLMVVELSGGWETDTLRVDIPEELFHPGTGTLDLAVSDYLRPEDGFEEPRGVFVQSLQLRADLDSGELETWRALTTPKPLPTPSRKRSDHALSRPVSELPNVLMILIDSARVDHFSGYGYDRPTTPHIDALARRGVRFDRLFAEAPYTRNSVATLFSGRSWRDHGVWSGDDALPEEAFTLAEAFRSAGYQTLAISDNAHVGRNAGSAQGFDEFLEAWTVDSPQREAQPLGWWPEAPVELFDQRLKQGLDPKRPTFFYLHLLPPHVPYFPGPDHDLFGPADYEGPITGISPDLSAFDRGARPAQGPDYDRLVSLYDGSLHRADALVQRALQAWNAQAGRRPTLFVILSDHGEAFGEHGRFGHNQTPFDEMLHVPFILSPAELVPPEVRSGRGELRSMSDVYPLLLRSLGLGLPDSVSMPAAFFEIYDHPMQSRSEIFIRCSLPIYARRTATTLAVFQDWNQQDYFDLGEDPSAQHDLRRTKSGEWRREWRKLRDFLAQPSPFDRSAQAELSPEDIERLKALGYM